MFGIDDIIPAATKLITDVIDRVIPDKTAALEAKSKVVEMQINGELAQQQGLLDMAKKGQDIVLAEANSSSWITKNWRPLTMLGTFAMLCLHWFGFAGMKVSPAEIDWFYRIYELGLGGYVIGRSVEKVAPTIAGALGK